MDLVLAWLLGALLIASLGLAISLWPRIAKAWQEGESGPFWRFLIAVELHAIGLLIGTAGRLFESLPVVAVGVAVLVTSKEIWQWPEKEGRGLFYAQLAAIGLWTVYIFARGW